MPGPSLRLFARGVKKDLHRDTQSGRCLETFKTLSIKVFIVVPVDVEYHSLYAFLVKIGMIDLE